MTAKKVGRKKYRRKESGFKKYNHEIIGIVILAIGILIGFGFYYRNSVGLFGETLRVVFLGMMGLPALAVPPLMVVYAFFLILRKEDKNFNLRCIYCTVLLLLLSAIIQTGFYDEGDFENLTVFDSLIKFYKNGINYEGGGVIGGIISIPFLMLFKVLGTIIILTAISIIDIVLLTNISIANFIRNIRGLFVAGYKKFVRLISEGLKKKKTDKDLRPQIKAESNVIDFDIEKTSRESQEKTGSIAAGVPEAAAVQEVQTIEFIMKDLKKSTGAEVGKIKNTDKQPPGEGKVVQQDTPEPLCEEAGASLDKDSAAVAYRYPPIDLLNQNLQGDTDFKAIRNSAIEGAKKLEDTLKSFGVEARVINVSRGPAVTRYELQPSPGIKVSKIVNLSDDISLNLAASGVRIEAPIPGKAAVGIEVPNKDMSAVFLREVIDCAEFAEFPSKLAFAVGKDISGEIVVADIAKMPHMLIAGATGAGKSVCINSLIISLIYKASPEEIKLLMIDPKVVELGVYNGIPHLLIPVVTDPKKAAGALNWAVQEMVNRYKLFAEKGVRDLKGYNEIQKEAGEQGTLPQIVIIIDELADLMMVAPNDVEDAICRLAQMARAAGMHLVIATQRPSVDVITGIIKANIPSRISFAVTSQVDSRTILDMAGAEKLLGKGDMLFYPIGQPKPIRVKGAFVSEKEVEGIVRHIKATGEAEYNESIIEEINSEGGGEEEKKNSDNDELLPQAIELVVEGGQASVSMIQRKFKVGYARAARIVDQMEERGIVGRFEGSKPRQVLITRLQWQEMQMKQGE
ncbi:DNA translocase FtsK [Anaerobacterium chartisolvens]|uniref:DNA translocase FtsK n=1 Tax=Anaerobacterium chartisolvens TaxID=1297424 RepID=A0A369AZP4_9FIRM|nr:DNA translocase FtsK [Anaerobacterium chartisolvens]RCX13808.1 DNA translocase FtsK [Anaerobacterium chartisolvens]